MSRMGYRAKVDANQSAIVGELRARGVSVALAHDDIICGYRGHNYWFEIKNPDGLFKADGVTFNKGKIKKSQELIRRTWLGQYDVVWSIEQILAKINYRK